jgi:hypothetical protein
MFKKLFTLSVLGFATAMPLLATGCTSGGATGVNGLTGTPTQDTRPAQTNFKGQYPAWGSTADSQNHN